MLFSLKSFKKMVKVLRAVRPSEVELQISIFSFGFELDDEKMDYLEGLVHNPPSNKREILALLENLAPESVTVTIEGNFALGVGSSALGVGAGFTYSKDDLIERFDDIF